jgi:hypothetical protein
MAEPPDAPTKEQKKTATWTPRDGGPFIWPFSIAALLRAETAKPKQAITDLRNVRK